MFGLITSSELEATQSNNVRRKIFYQYPQGAFPLMGLLSLTENAEETDKQSFGWNEDRYLPTQTYTAQANAAGPFTDTTGVNGAPGTDLTAAGWSETAGDTIRVFVTDVSIFRERDVVFVKDAPGAGGTTVQIRGVVVAVYVAENSMDIQLVQDVNNALNTTAANNLLIFLIGSAAVEGGYSKQGGTAVPLEVFNYTQIFRTVVGPFTRNALKQGQKFDSTGIYKHTAHKAAIRHMEAMEHAMYFGVKRTDQITDSDDGEVKSRKLFGGLLWYIQQWELGNTTNGGEINYRPGGADLTGLAWDADEQKRHLRFNGGKITKAQWSRVIQRIFDNNSDVGWEKIVICGNGFLASVNEVAENSVVKMTKMDEKADEYSMHLVSWSTVFGDLHFKTHPAFTKNPLLTNSAFVVDVGCLKYHPFQDSDTELLAFRNARDFDGRKDEWLTEFGPEIDFPENHMFLDNLGGFLL